MEQNMKFCRKCGKQIKADAKFCRFCGFRFDAVVQQTSQNTASQAVRGQMMQAFSQFPGVGMPMQRIAASVNAGEEFFDLYSNGIGNPADYVIDASGYTMGVVNGIKGRVTQILSPGQTLVSGIKSFGSNLAGFIKNPKALIPTIILVIMWVILGMVRDSNNVIVKALSLLTFSEGGLNRNVIGLFGGVMGKGAVAVMFATLVQGGGKSVISGVKNMVSTFKGKDGKMDILSFIIGIVIGIVGYLIFVGVKNASAGTAMAGIAGIVLSLKALGDKSSFLYKLAESITSKTNNGVRTVQNGKLSGLFTGVTTGFALITMIMSLVG